MDNAQHISGKYYSQNENIWQGKTGDSMSSVAAWIIVIMFLAFLVLGFIGLYYFWPDILQAVSNIDVHNTSSLIQ